MGNASLSVFQPVIIVDTKIGTASTGIDKQIMDLPWVEGAPLRAVLITRGVIRGQRGIGIKQESLLEGRGRDNATEGRGPIRLHVIGS